MIYIFIAVFLVLVVMNLFMLLILRQMVRTTGRQVRKDAGRLLAVWHRGQLVKAREEEPQAAEGELTGVFTMSGERDASAYRATATRMAIPKKTAFQDDDFSSSYRKIRKLFEQNPQTAASRFANRLNPDQTHVQQRREVLAALMELCSFDNVYRISLLPNEDQEKLFMEILKPEEAQIYEEWKADSDGGDIIRFAQWLQLEYQKLSTSILVQCPQDEIREEADTEGKQADILYLPERSICEGFRILYREKIYDYSI